MAPTRFDEASKPKRDWQCSVCTKKVGRPWIISGFSNFCRRCNGKKGDVKTHIFKIITDPIGSEDPGGMFYNDPTDNALVSRGHLTLDFACLGCHDGDSAVSLTLEAAAAVAPLIHAN